MYAYPEEHAEIKLRVEALRKEQENVVSEASETLHIYKSNGSGCLIVKLTCILGCVGEQAKKVLHETISRDQFLSYMTSDISVATLSKELYRYSS